MKLGALAVLCTLAAARPAMAEPCPLFLLEDKPLREPVIAAPDGGIVVGEIPTPAGPGGASEGVDTWSLRVKGKRVALKADAIAPGLVVVRPPVRATEWELVGTDKKRRSRATIATKKLPDLLDAPPATRITSGTTQSRHPNSFVNVELATPAPKEAIALVLSKQKGPAYSWGVAFAGATSINVFSTGSGCFSTQSEGTVQAQPGDIVTLMWVDQHGRRSRVTPPIVVEKP